MLTLTEIVYAIRGLSLLVRFDARGLEYFDRSIQGFWRSFQVAVLVAPIAAIAFAHQISDGAAHAGWARLLSVEILSYIAGWFLFPVAAYELCRRIGRDAEYVGYIAVYNWSQLILVFMLLLPLPIEFMFGESASGATGFLSSLIVILFFGYLWFLARAALRVQGALAFGIIALDLFLTYMLSEIVDAMTMPVAGV